MFYIYDKKGVQYKKLLQTKLGTSLGIAIGLSLAISYGIGRFTWINSLSEYEKNILLINMKQTPFSEDELILLMKDLGVKFPHIVLAQSKLETNNYRSGIFKENHNLFGMKEARSRISTARGTNRNHAYYDTWESSVYDYAFYQCRYLSAIRNEAQYYSYLSGRYAEDPLYVQKVKKLAGELKDKF